MAEDKVLLNSMQPLMDVLGIDTGSKKDNEFKFEPLKVQNEVKNTTPNKPTKADKPATPTSSSPMTYTPMTGAGGKATYGLNFESSKNSNDFINTNSPFASYRITSKTGARDTGVNGASRNHAGIDRAVAEGTAVKLPMDVTFYAAGYDNARGNWIEVKDSNGYILHFQHLKDYGTYSKGQVITAGSTIARSGSSGVGSGAHLHEEYYAPNGKNVTESYWAKYASGAGNISGGDDGGGSSVTGGDSSADSVAPQKPDLFSAYTTLMENDRSRREENLLQLNSGKNGTNVDLKFSQNFWSKPEEERMQWYKDNNLWKGDALKLEEADDRTYGVRLTGEAIESGISGMANAYAGFMTMLNDKIEPLAKNVRDFTDKFSFSKYILNENAGMLGDFFGKTVADKIDKWDVSEKLELENAINEIDNEYGRGVARLYSDVVRTGVEMVPTIILALSGAGAAGAGGKAVGFLGRAATWGKNLIKNPAFWDTYVRETGSTYKEAIKSGASDDEAFTAANITGFLNAAVEHSGGLEKSIPKLAGSEKFLKKLIGAWGKNALEEGFEEGVQDNITALVKKLTYKKDAEWFSMTDNEAVFNPVRTGTSMAMGYIIGGILGTGNATISSAVSSINSAFRNAASPERQEIKAKFARLEERIKNGDFDGMTMEEIQSDPEVREFTDFVKRKSDESGSYSISVLPDGKRYVQADEQVIKSKNPEEWEREIIDYVNNTVRHGHDFTILTDDGEKISITGRTAWKLGHRGRYNDKYYFVKGNASGAIDEVVQVSEPQMRGNQKNEKPGFKNHRKGFAENGWQYRTAHFRDLDGQYYQLDLSVGKNAKGNEMYNIGAIKKVPFPVTGSKAEGTTPHSINILQNGENVKKKITPLNRAQRRFFSSFGVDVEVREDLPLGVNGKIMTRSGKLLVSPYATVKGWKLTRHEFTHYLRTHFNKAYNAYADAVRLEMGDRWQERYDTVRKKYEAFAERYPDEDIAVDADTITEEVVAEYAEGFNNAKFMKRIAKRDLSVGVAIRNAFRNIIQKVKAVFTPKELKANCDSIQRLMTAKDMWEQAVIEAAKSPKTVLKNAVGGKRLSISSSFVADYDAWVKEGRKNGVRINIGVTSKALQSIGVKEHNIIWDSGKINKTLKKHPYLNDEILKQVPNLIENPIIVMQSKSSDSRLTMFGEVYDGDGVPVMAVIELMPTSLNNGFVLDEVKVVSTHSRKNIKKPSDITQTQSIIDTSKILYIEPNKKRTDNWLVANRLQLPLHITQYGSINRVSYSLEDVKGNFSYTPPTGREGESRHDWEEDMWGDGSIVRDMEGTRRERKKQAKRDGKNIFQFYNSEIRVLENIINDLQRAAGGKEPRHYGLLNDVKQLTVELRAAERENNSLKAENIMLDAKLKILRGIFGDITSEHLKSMPIRQLADRYKKLTGSHMTAKDIASRLESIYSTISHHMHGSSDGGVSGYGEMLKLVRDMYESRKLAGDDGEVSDARMQIIADNMVQEIFKHKASAEGKQGVIEAFAKAYGLKYSDLISSYKAYINRLEADAKTTKEERNKEAVKDLIQKHSEKTEAREEAPVYDEKPAPKWGKMFGTKIKARDVQIVHKKPIDAAMPGEDKVYVKFDHNSARKLEKNAEYNGIIDAIKGKVTKATDENGYSGDYGRHSGWVYTTSDVWRNFRMFFGKNYGKMKELILDPFEDAKLYKEYFEEFYLDILEQKVVKELKIKRGSKLSAAVQYYGEYVKPGRQSTIKDDDVSAIEAGKIYHSLNAEQKARVKKADEIIRFMYDGILESVNHGRRTIYPYADQQAQELEKEKQELVSYSELLKLSLEDGELEQFRDYNYRMKKLDAMNQRKEGAERTILRIRKLMNERMHRYDERIEKAEAELAACKSVDSKKYNDLRDRLAKLVENRDTCKAVAETEIGELDSRIKKLGEEYDLYGSKLVDKIHDDIDRMNKRIGEIDARLYGEDVSYGRVIEAKKNYYHHMREEADKFAMEKGWFGAFINNGVDRKADVRFGNPDKDGAIALELAGRSEGTKPKARWQGAFQRRRDAMKDVKFDAVGGFLHYLPQAAYAAAIDPQIAVFRKLADDLRDRKIGTGENKSNSVANFAVFLDEFANELAGKTSPILDRLIVDNLGRNRLAMMQKASGYLKGSMILYNVSSMVSQIGNLPLGIGYIGDPICLMKGIPDMFAAINPNSEISKAMAQSQFMNERFSNHYNRRAFAKSNVKYAADFVANVMLSSFDRAATDYIWSAAYAKGKKKGADPIRYADDVTRRTVAGRGIGEMTIAQRSKTVGMLMPFTVEAGNTVRVFRDIAMDASEDKSAKAIAFAVWQMLSLFASTFVANAVIKWLRGSDLGLVDPIGTVYEGVKDDKNALQILGMLSGDALSASASGSIIASVYPENGAGVLPKREDLFGTRDPLRFGNDTMFANPLKFAGKAVGYALDKDIAGAASEAVGLLPGGSQARKTIKGAAALKRGEVRKSNGDLKFEVERTPGNFAKGLLFGENALKEADVYYETDGKLKLDVGEDIEGFKHNKKSRTLTVGDALNKKEVKLEGSKLKAFEEDRLKEYTKMFNTVKKSKTTVKNPYAGKTGAENTKKRMEENEKFEKLLTALVEQGDMTLAEKSKLNSAYRRGENVSVSGVQFTVPRKMKVNKKFTNLTKAQQDAYVKNIEKLKKNGEISKAQADEHLKYIKAGGMVTVSEYITGNYSSLSDAEKKELHSQMNGFATQTAKEKIKN